MNNPYLIGIISWLLPGVGHLMQGRFVRGISIGVVIWTMFIIAIFSGGAYYPGLDFKDGSLLYLLNILSSDKVFRWDHAAAQIRLKGQPDMKIFGEIAVRWRCQKRI